MINLLHTDLELDSLQQYKQTIVRRPVYAQISSVTASEFFAGGQNGFQPEYRLTMFGPDYEGEDLVEIGEKIYSIYRVYQARNDKVELYVEQRRGNAEEAEDEGDGSEP